ncbi:fumarylacetoacetate hydrolase family protein [Halomicrococcus sp. NG-SE-24]|uniref:fumarylacetoacetate hydrolase family protein n=1 Tax=Halomicrococcus sp. NG-SE-24 TaxID=3436928 RepID=UPI003D97E726
MRYYRLQDGPQTRLIARDGDRLVDLTSVRPSLTCFADLARSAAVSGLEIDTITERYVDEASRVDPSVLAAMTVPVEAEEVWAAGVTYRISEQAREAESGLPEIYLDVYDAERPELFFKATPSRTVGPGDEVGIRDDSNWNVPEPELGIVLYQGEIVGYTVGNDMSSRAIEGQNPLYLPQAKVYDSCCALGPCIVSQTSLDDPHDLAMSMRIVRDDDVVYEGETSTAEMVRTCEELVSYFTRHNTVPEVAVLLTGTSLVPDEEFTLQEDDELTLTVESIGTLENTVTVV